MEWFQGHVGTARSSPQVSLRSHMQEPSRRSGQQPEKTPMITIAGDLTHMDDKTLGNTNETTSTDVSQSGSCMEVHGDEERMRDYEEMEEEDMGDRVMINQEGDITKRYCQMITTGPDYI